MQEGGSEKRKEEGEKGRTDVAIALCKEVGNQARENGHKTVAQGQVPERFRQPLGGEATEEQMKGGKRGGMRR